MKRLLFILFVITFSLKGFSQDFASMFTTPLVGKDISTFHTVNKNTNLSTLFMVDKKRAHACKLDLRMQLKDSLSYEKPDESYKSIIGGIEGQDTSLIFWATQDFSTFLVQSFNFKERKVVSESIPFDIGTEKVIRFFSEQQHFYILSSLRSTNEIKLTIVDENRAVTEKKINISLLNASTLATIKSLELGEEMDINKTIELIESNAYIFYTESAKKNKCYSNDKNITLTFDSNAAYTSIITIDLNNFSITEKNINKTQNSDKNEPFKSNSFLMDDTLFQIGYNSKDILISIRDLNNNLLKEFSSFNNDFSNVEYVTEKEIGVKKVNLKREKFLNSLDDSRTGISCYKVNDTYQISIGKPDTLILSEEKRHSTYATIGGLAGGFIGALIGSLIDYSSSSKQNFTSFMDNGRTYFNYTINAKYEHINNRYDQLGAEKLRYFLKDSDPGLGQILFKVDNVSYFGCYFNKDKKYFIRKFID